MRGPRAHTLEHHHVCHLTNRPSFLPYARVKHMERFRIAILHPTRPALHLINVGRGMLTAR